jgi:hypothetical protein
MALQHLRSSTANKRPTPGAMSDGQLALNTNLVSPGLFFKDSNGDSVKIGPVHVGTTAPNVSPAVGGEAGNSLGEAWLDTTATNPILKVFNGSAFVAVQPVGTGTVVSTTDTGTVTSTMILDGTILNADVNASAAIAGTKISPDFGSQNAVTTGTSTAASFIPTSSTVPTNGVYLPAANNVAISTGGSGRLFVDSSGNVGLGSTPKTWGGGAIGALFNGSGSITAFSDEVSYGNNVYFDGAWRYARNDTAQLLQLGSGDVPLIFYSALTGTADAAITWSERFTLDSSGRLGIGTSSPNSPIMIQGSSQPVIRAYTTDTGTSNQLLFDNASNYHYGAVGTVGGNSTITGDVFGLGYTGSNTTDFTPVLSWTANTGRVGIGSTADPGAYNAKLWIDSTTDSTFTVNTTGSASLCQVVLRNSNVNGEARILNATGGPLTFYRSFGNEAARIDTSGRLLVGTPTSTSATVNDLVGKTQIASSENAALALHGHSSTALYGADIVFTRSRSATIGTNTIVQNGDEFGRIYFTGANGTGFDYGASIQAVVDGTPGASNNMPGRLVFSTTPSGSASPVERMRIDNQGRIFTFNSNTSNNSLTVSHAAGAGTSVANFIGSHSATAVNTGTTSFLVWTNGNVENTNNSYGALSDVKLKENIVDAGSQWNDLKALQVRNYNFKEETGQQTHTQIGLVAQEVELVSPGLVGESPDRDAEGNDLGTVTKSVSYSVLYMKAVKALQEAMERIETLEQRLTAAGID